MPGDRLAPDCRFKGIAARACLSLRSQRTLKPEYINVQQLCMELRSNLWYYIITKEVTTMNTKSKFSPKMLDRIAEAWYKGYKHGTGVGRYHFRIEYNWEKKCWGIWRCNNDHLDTEIIDSDGRQTTMWEWVEELPHERFQALKDQEIMIL